MALFKLQDSSTLSLPRLWGDGITKRYAAPCLFTQQNQNSHIFMIVHMDDCNVVGHKKALLELVKKFTA
jgi:hypothetical protein